MVPILDLTFASVSDSRYTGLKNQFELKFLDTTEVMVSFIHYYCIGIVGIIYAR